MSKRKAVKVSILCALLCCVGILSGIGVSERVIYRTDSGFEPSRIVVFPGTSVRFVNKTDTQIWPASDLHPSHSVYSDFDPHEGIRSQTSWLFRFRKAGSWSFHDHLDPQTRGTVTVAFLPDFSFFRSSDASPVLTGTYDACMNAPSDEGGKCWEEAAIARTRAIGVDRVLVELADLFPTSDGLQTYCHDVTHVIGHQAYRRFRQGEVVQFSKQQAVCSWGFFHGFMEQMFRDGGTLADSAALCNAIEEENMEIERELISSCYHGLGHGSVLKHEEDPAFDFWKILDTGIAACEESSAEMIDRENCASGVIDGLLATGIAGDYPIPESVYRDPHQICRRFEEYKVSCYSATNWFLLQSSGGDFPKAASYVRTIPYEEIARDTMHWLDNLTVRLLSESDKEKPAAWCSAMEASFQKPCITGFALGYMLNKGTQGREYLEGVAFCSQDVLSDGQTTDCYTAVLEYLSGHDGRETVDTLCAELGPAIPLCRKQGEGKGI